jgi:hypothetical protein
VKWDWISPLTLKKEMGIEEEMAFVDVVEGSMNPTGAQEANNGGSKKRLSLVNSMKLGAK